MAQGINRPADMFGITPLYEMMNRMLQEDVAADRWQRDQVARSVPLDVYETEQGYVARLAVPGLKPEAFHITIDRNVLTVQGRVAMPQPENARWLVSENLYGDFSRSVQFPGDIDVEQVDARLENGMLHVSLPKAANDRVRRITINTPIEQRS